MDAMYDAVIVGGGPAGLTAAIYLGRAKYKVLVLEKEQLGGQITITTDVVNYPGISRTTGKALTDTMYKQADAFGAEFAIADVLHVELDGEIKALQTSKGEVRALAVILATGANPRKIGFTGEAEFQGRGVAYCATCDGEFFTGMDIFVIGGGFAAVEESIFLTKYAKSITILVRKDRFACAQTVVDELKRYPTISVKFNTEVVKVGGDSLLSYAEFKNNKTGETWRYEPADGSSFGLFVFAGYVPNTKLFADVIALDEQGYVLTDRDGKTNIDGVYAAGDVRIKNLRQVVTAVSDGAVAATASEKYIAAMHDALGLPEFSRPDAKQPPEAAAAGSGEEDDEAFLSAAIREQLVPVFAKFASPVVIKAWLDHSELSGEISRFLSEWKGLTDKISCATAEAAPGTMPGIEILRQDGSASGIFFHGVPGGHEFNSFILALYNTAGPGQDISPAVRQVLEEIAGKKRRIRIQIIVSLSCTMCPDVVIGAQRLAAASPYIAAEMYDLQHVPHMRQKYNIMSVPCMIINEEAVYFGKKNIEEIAGLLRQFL